MTNKQDVYTDLEHKKVFGEYLSRRDGTPIKIIEKMVNEIPNDQELGEKIRNFIKNINNESI